MKKIFQPLIFIHSFCYILLFLLFASTPARASDLEVYLMVRMHHSYGVSCHGGSDGNISSIITGGQPPYLFSWTNSSGTYTAFSRTINGLPAETYTLTVTDANNQVVQVTETLTEPDALHINLFPAVFEGGYNNPCQGCREGAIDAEVSGGVPGYTYQWSTNSTTQNLAELMAGPYSLTITDVNGCTSSASKTLTEPTPLHFISVTSPLISGTNISCVNGSNGVIDISLTGGVGPYTYMLNGIKTHNQPATYQYTNLTAGLYQINVYDQNNISIETQITLTEPAQIEIGYSKTVYPNGFNLSCFNCGNGSLTATVNGGRSPYTYLWNNGQTTASITNLSEFTLSGERYKVTVTDANGCVFTGQETSLRAPQREDWSMQGNAGTTANQFMGTTDNKDFVIRTNNQERIKFTGSGNVIIPGLVSSGSTDTKSLFVDATGKLTTLVPYSAACGSLLPVNPNTWLTVSSTQLTNCSHNFGFGIYQPMARIHVSGQARFSPSNANTTEYLNIGFDNGLKINAIGSDLFINNNSTQNVKVNTGSSQGDFVTGGNTYLSSISGKVGIGTLTPKEKLSIGDEFVFHDGGNKVIARNFYYDGVDKRITNGYASALYFTQNGELCLKTAGNGSSGDQIIWNKGIKINSAGNVGINEEPDAQYSLNVSGTINTSNLLINGQAISDVIQSNIPSSIWSLNTNGYIVPLNTYKCVVIGGIGNYDINHLNDVSLDADYKLAVNGHIIATELRIKSFGNWPDYVFAYNYKKMDLLELETYFKKYKHLPDFEDHNKYKDSGINISEMNVKLLKNIEEIYLSLIELKKENEIMKKQISKLIK